MARFLDMTQPSWGDDTVPSSETGSELHANKMTLGFLHHLRLVVGRKIKKNRGTIRDQIFLQFNCLSVCRVSNSGNPILSRGLVESG